MSNSMKKLIDLFLSKHRIALVGISSNPKDFTRVLYKEFVNRNYDVIPVSPRSFEIGGRKTVASVKDLESKPDAVLIMTSPKVTDRIVKDCADTGIYLVWMYRGAGKGAVSESAVRFCRENNISVIDGYCPFMFFDSTGIIHRIHRFIAKMTGSYPK